jgi:SH3-like domain-containing protein
LAAITLVWTVAAHAQESAGRKPGTVTGLPIPRFVSLKATEVNARVGPGPDYQIAWVFKRAGLPVEVLAEFENWRQVRDSDGVTGWCGAACRPAHRHRRPWIKEHGRALTSARRLRGSPSSPAPSGHHACDGVPARLCGPKGWAAKTCGRLSGGAVK